MSATLDSITIEASDGATMPRRATAGSAGIDVYASADCTLAPGKVTAVSTGIRMHIPSGYYVQLVSRSGFAVKNIITVAGLIDSDYRGEIKVLLLNLNDRPFHIYAETRVTQMVICQVNKLPLVADTITDDTERGSGGFGSTG